MCMSMYNQITRKGKCRMQNKTEVYYYTNTRTMNTY